MENAVDQKTDGRSSSPIRGGKGRNKPGAGRVGRVKGKRKYRKNPNRNVQQVPVEADTFNLFLEFENAAEQKIRQVIEEEMLHAEARIMGRLIGRKEEGRRKELAAA